MSISVNKIGEPELCVRHIKQVLALGEGDILYPEQLLAVYNAEVSTHFMNCTVFKYHYFIFKKKWSVGK